MISVDDHVTLKGTGVPVGIVEALNETLMTATVRWGIADGRKYTDEILQSDLEIVEGIIPTE